jgi:hypothetical protein
MPIFGNLTPSRGTSVRWPQRTRYTSLRSSDDFHDDPEKHSQSDDEDSFSSPFSSRQSSGTHQPMLRESPKRSRWNRPALFTIRSPGSFQRLFTLALGSTLVLFILMLAGGSWKSNRDVHLGLGTQKHVPPVWESFPFLKRYHGGIRKLVSRKDNVPEYPSANSTDDIPVVPHQITKREEDKQESHNLPPMEVFDPYPDYEKDPSYTDFQAPVQCYLDEAKTIKIPPMRVYNGVVQGTPDNIYGSYEVMNIRNDVCFERFGRLGPYGLGYSKEKGGSGAGMEGDREGIDQVWKEYGKIDFREIKWAEVQDRCNEMNRMRFQFAPRSRNHFFQTMASGGPEKESPDSFSADKVTKVIEEEAPQDTSTLSSSAEMPTSTSEAELGTSKKRAAKKLLPRHAVLIRTWWDYQYDEEDLFYLRALVSELSIQSGGEYTLHFLIHVKDDNLPIWSDDETYQRVLNDALPAEFRGMGTLWTERQMGLIYGGLEETFHSNLPVHGVYRSAYMPMQYFAHMHPEYDFFWQWEMDLRYTGHFYHLFQRLGEWARKQPRKLMWERSARFYVPSEHGTWDDFNHLVRVQTEHGTASKSNQYSKLAEYHPDLPASAQAAGKPEDPIWGPVRPLDDAVILDTDPEPPHEYKADNYEWGVGEDADLIVLNPLFDPEGTNWILREDITGYNRTRGLPQRRTAIVTAGRLSRRLLETMHIETSLHRHSMFTEMWPATTCLHHGLKAVYAPHPVFIDRRWPTDYLASIFNGGRNGQAGGARLSAFSDERQHNFLGTTWYYHAGFPGNLWKRWLGYKVDNDGGEQEELAGEGRMCLPAMLLHPVKHVDMVYQE